MVNISIQLILKKRSLKSNKYFETSLCNNKFNISMVYNILTYLNKVEAILFKKVLKMSNPTLEMDLSVLVFEATYYRYSKEEKHKEKALLLFNQFIKVFADNEYQNGFLEGFEGVFWVVNYLQKCKIIEEDSLLDDLIPYFIESLEIDLKNNNFDVYHGSINKLEYIINSNKFPSKLKEEYVNLFLDNLYKSRTENEIGIFWYGEIYDEQKEIMKEIEAVNLGIPHGLPGLLMFLVRLKEMNFKHTKLEILIQGILKTILNSKNKIIQYSHFPEELYILNYGKYFHSSSRLAYCYGDLGITYAVLYASKVLNKPELKKEISLTIELLKNRMLTNSNIDVYEDYLFLDTGFCHGLAGIVYMFSKINELIDDTDFEKRLAYWKKELLFNLQKQLAITPPIYYPEYKQPLNKNEERYTIDEQSILAGYSGTGLVLLSLVYNKYDWSDFFMLY